MNKSKPETCNHDIIQIRQFITYDLNSLWISNELNL